MNKLIVMLAEGFEEIEALTVVDILRRAEVECITCSLKDDVNVIGSHNIAVKVDTTINTINIDEFCGIILPGGMPGSTNLRDNSKVIDMIKEFNNKGKLIGAICAAPIVLEKAGVITGKKVTSYPNCLKPCNSFEYTKNIVEVDGNIITSRGPATAPYFAFEILKYIGLSVNADALKKGMLYV